MFAKLLDILAISPFTLANTLGAKGLLTLSASPNAFVYEEGNPNDVVWGVFENNLW